MGVFINVVLSTNSNSTSVSIVTHTYPSTECLIIYIWNVGHCSNRSNTSIGFLGIRFNFIV